MHMKCYQHINANDLIVITYNVLNMCVVKLLCELIICLLLYTVSQKKGPTLKRYSSKLYGSILMIFGRNIQKSLE